MKVGDKICVPDKQKSNFGDYVTGGMATIRVIKNMQDGDYAIMEETDKIQWNLNNLIVNQTEYLKLYGKNKAKFYSEPFERDNKLW